MKIGFDNNKYLTLQAQHIRARREQFGDKLYIEFGGKLFDDYHASRVLPGFQPDSKIRMLASIRDDVEIVVVICAGVIEKKKVRGDLGIGYDEDVLRLMDVFRGLGFYVGSVVITQYAGQPAADAFIKRLTALGVRSYRHYPIAGYPSDVAHIVSDDGKYYMYYGGWGHCNMVRLSDDLLSIVPFDDGTTYREVTPKNYVEGPFMLKRKGKYYFMWSEGGWGGPDYCVAYAIADSPFGPFERVGKILQQDPAIATGAGHHSVIQVPGKDEYYIVYHRRPLTETAANSRETCIDRLYFDKDGHIVPVKMTNEGVKAVKKPKRK